MIPTPAYTSPFTKRVLGFVIDEKKIARRLTFCKSALISSNLSKALEPYPNACTTFWFPTISLISDVISARFSDCALNIVYVLFAIKLATNNDTGVIKITTREIFTSIVNIKSNVPTIVTIPVNNCENPISNPSENCSTSVMILLIVSPY